MWAEDQQGAWSPTELMASEVCLRGKLCGMLQVLQCWGWAGTALPQSLQCTCTCAECICVCRGCSPCFCRRVSSGGKASCTISGTPLCAAWEWLHRTREPEHGVLCRGLCGE